MWICYLFLLSSNIVPVLLWAGRHLGAREIAEGTMAFSPIEDSADAVKDAERVMDLLAST